MRQVLAFLLSEDGTTEVGKHIIAVIQLNRRSITPDKAQSINLTDSQTWILQC